MGLDHTIAVRDDPGGTAISSKRPLVGTENQVAWAEQIRANADAEFARVAGALHSVALRQTEPRRSHTQMVIAILEEKRSGVMARSDAGYFIQEWQELRDQVRLLITEDLRYKAATSNRVTTTESTDH